jgi:hypothetical protein
MAKASDVIAALVAGLLAVSACSSQRADVELLWNGPAQQFDATTLGAYAVNQQKIMEHLATTAGTTNPPVGSEEWRKFVNAGFDFADSQCETYMAALRRLDIARRRAVQQTNLAGAATAGILGIVGAASSAIAITAIAFGLTSATIDNVSGGLLYELPPSTVRDLVERTKVAYEQRLTSANWQDRPSSFRTIRGYVELCLPSVIEAHASAAIRAASPKAEGGTLFGNMGIPPRVQIATPEVPSLPRPGTPGAPLRANVQLTPTTTPTTELAAGRGTGPGERELTTGEVRDLQKALCLPQAGQTGALDPDTRAAIDLFRQARSSQATGELKPIEVTTLLGAGPCTQHSSALERFRQ